MGSAFADREERCIRNGRQDGSEAEISVKREDSLEDGLLGSDHFPTTAKQQAAETENISEAVLSNLTSGVVLLNTAGLVQQVNPAAKTILGYASPVHFHARDLFKGVSALRGLEESISEGNTGLLEAVENCVRAGRPARSGR